MSGGWHRKKPKKNPNSFFVRRKEKNKTVKRSVCTFTSVNRPRRCRRGWCINITAYPRHYPNDYLYTANKKYVTRVIIMFIYFSDDRHRGVKKIIGKKTMATKTKKKIKPLIDLLRVYIYIYVVVIYCAVRYLMPI